MKIKEQFKKLGLGSRQLILGGLIILIGIAGYINFNYTDVPAGQDNIEEISIPTAIEPVDEFAQLKTERDNAKSQSLDVLREIVDNEKTSKEERDSAQQQMATTVQNMEKEKVIESLLSAKNFEEVIVYISTDNANVVVKTEGLVPTQIAQIKDIVIENTGFGADNIKIVEKNY
ncbi:MAG: SpoIIIAH-like family protein [Clostridia bacterium]|nr:SpoIIIAH-like family protein [Clostridia bacterium]